MPSEDNPGPAGTQPIPLEWTRPAREWLPAALVAKALQANERVDAAPTGSIIMRLWPRALFSTPSGVQAEAVGPCRFCDLIHAHGVGADPFRRLHCAGVRPPLSSMPNQPEEVLVRFELDEPMPEDLAFELTAWRPDLLTLADIAARHIHHRYLKKIHRRKPVTGAKYQGPGPWKREHAQLAFRRIVDAHVLDEHISRMVHDGICAEDAERVAVARFLRDREGRDGLSRLHEALLLAYRAAGRGETAA